jgi:ubiquinone/menaquinone biosynthesis C-methylase UbiE
MSPTGPASVNPYVLATGSAAARRLHALHEIYSPVGRSVLREAGLRKGMRVADFGCGVGSVTRMLAEIVGQSGLVTGIDVSAQQLSQARNWCYGAGLTNTSFVEADASRTHLPRSAFDLVYCRFLLMHLPDPMQCLREMHDVLRPGGILVVEDGDLSTATSIPASAQDTFAELFSAFGQVRGLDYSLGRTLYHQVKRAGFSDVAVKIHQPAITTGESRYLLKWSVEEAAPALIDAGVVTRAELERRLDEMQDAIDNPDILILAPQMFLVSGRKALPQMRPAA